ncbi:hypothetical protein SEA_EVAA_72 [Gordonia phage Evaa]|nr:hypothetical protein SEA_EVAA_72 [Gordonia phage Evaa]
MISIVTDQGTTDAAGTEMIGAMIEAQEALGPITWTVVQFGLAKGVFDRAGIQTKIAVADLEELDVTDALALAFWVTR